ncbi:MAG: SHOCT domain-containing protein [Saprospiraceae bacterium]|nr:SHOCT domain-containing protein [Saprospiraceae bacterium]
MMIFWIFIIAIGIWAIWYFEKSHNSISKQLSKNTSIEILKRRFAKGEITEEEYDEKRAVLEEDEYLNTHP